MIVYGVNRQGEQAKAGGWGHLLDQGSTYDWGQEVLRAVVRAHDGGDLSPWR